MTHPRAAWLGVLHYRGAADGQIVFHRTGWSLRHVEQILAIRRDCETIRRDISFGNPGCQLSGLLPCWPAFLSPSGTLPCESDGANGGPARFPRRVHHLLFLRTSNLHVAPGWSIRSGGP